MGESRDDWHTEETYKGLFQLSSGVLRFGAIVNGGAAIALLALLGDLYRNGSEVPPLQCAMGSFIVGIVVAGLAQLTAYLTQLALYQEEAHGKPETGFFQHQVLLWLSLLLVLASIALFCWGAFSATAALTSV